MFSLLKHAIIFIVTLGLGVFIGGYLFSDTQPRSFLTIHDCQKTNCLKPNELAGLLGSIGIQKYPSDIPLLVRETDKTVVVKHPYSNAPIHYVLIPKKDIKDIGQLSEGDQEYIADILAVSAEIIREQDLTKYQFVTNGPDYQKVRYLHFHIISYDKK